MHNGRVATNQNKETEMKEPTDEQIANFAEYIVGTMSYQEVLQYVYDDVEAAMIEDKDLFLSNLEHHDKKAEDFNEENFRK